MSTKIAFLTATALAVVGIVVSVTVPEARCFFRLDSQCPPGSVVQMKDVELMVESVSQQPLSGVSVEFKSKGAPEVSITDSAGFVKIRIPEAEVKVTLRKEGFETLSYNIDLSKDPSTTRTYRLKSLDSNSSSISVPSSPSPSLVPSSEPKNSLPNQDSIVDCTNFGNTVQKHSQLISVSNKMEDPKSRFLLATNVPRSLVCKISKNSGILKLAYALSDNSSLNRIGIKVYVDGNLKKNFDLNRGEALRDSVDISGASGYKIMFEILSPQPATSFNSISDTVYILSK